MDRHQTGDSVTRYGVGPAVCLLGNSGELLHQRGFSVRSRILVQNLLRGSLIDLFDREADRIRSALGSWAIITVG